MFMAVNTAESQTTLQSTYCFKQMLLVYLLALAISSTKRRYIISMVAYYQHGTCHTMTLAALFASYVIFL
jgi:hypothetical protein